jgi:multisubunit Na+/H+ antiporter MnhB subunit
MHEIIFLLIYKYKDQNQIKLARFIISLLTSKVLGLIFITDVTNSLNGNLVSTIVVYKYPLSLKISRH